MKPVSGGWWELINGRRHAFRRRSHRWIWIWLWIYGLDWGSLSLHDFSLLLWNPEWMFEQQQSVLYLHYVWIITKIETLIEWEKLLGVKRKRYRYRRNLFKDSFFLPAATPLSLFLVPFSVAYFLQLTAPIMLLLNGGRSTNWWVVRKRFQSLLLGEEIIKEHRQRNIANGIWE